MRREINNLKNAKKLKFSNKCQINDREKEWGEIKIRLIIFINKYKNQKSDMERTHTHVPMELQVINKETVKEVSANYALIN